MLRARSGDRRLAGEPCAAVTQLRDLTRRPDAGELLDRAIVDARRKHQSYSAAAERTFKPPSASVPGQT